MSIMRKKRNSSEEDTDINMVPIMNMFLVLIPFLLMSASFFQLKVINTSVPTLSESSIGVSEENNVKVTAVVEIRRNDIEISILSEDIEYDEFEKWKHEFPKTDKDNYPLDQMSQWLQKIKLEYPKSDTLVVIPEESVVYDTIILTMDAGRFYNDSTLFPNVVLSGKVG